jgi:hypothetical protein
MSHEDVEVVWQAIALEAAGLSEQAGSGET